MILHQVTRWAYGKGIELIRVDVAASNARAIQCYEKEGFTRTGETWREARDLLGVDMSVSRYDFLRSHGREYNGVPWLRFIMMELRQDHPDSLTV